MPIRAVPILLCAIALLAAPLAADESARRPPAKAGANRALFDLPKAAYQVEVVPLEGERAELLGVKGYAVRFPSALTTQVEKNNTVHGLLFEPRTPTDRGAVFLPWFKDRDTKKAEWICRAIARGAECKVLFIAMGYQFQRAPPGYGSGSYIMRDSADHLQEWMRQSVLDTRRAGEWLVRERGVAAGRLGVAGISLGGFVAGLTYGVAPEFKAACTILAGGNLAPLLRIGAAAQLPPITEALGRMKIAPADLDRLLVPYDPITYADPRRKDGLLMINGLVDPVVPYPLGHALWKAYGEPKMVRLPAGHVTSIVFTPVILLEVIAHLRSALGGEGTPR